MYTLIGTPAARPFRVLWALEELAQDYDIVPAKPQSKEALEYNPAGKVPILLDGNEPIIDSVAIIQYLADKHADLTYPQVQLNAHSKTALPSLRVTISTAYCGQWRKTRSCFQRR